MVLGYLDRSDIHFPLLALHVSQLALRIRYTKFDNSCWEEREVNIWLHDEG